MALEPQVVGQLHLQGALDQPLGQLRQQPPAPGPTISCSDRAPANSWSTTSSGSWRRISSGTRVQDCGRGRRDSPGGYAGAHPDQGTAPTLNHMKSI